jgi:hypothetical protein
MSIIEGASVSVKTMSDGTLRLSIDIEPRNAQAAFALFGAPGRAVALAALKDGAGAVSSPPSTPQQKGGEWAKLAGMWCNDRDFWAFANATTHAGVLWHVDSPQTAKEFMCELSVIDSRIQLDSDPEALKRFNAEIRYPFMKYMQARGISK